MKRHSTANLSLRLLAGASVVLLAGCGDDAQKAALEVKPVAQAAVQAVAPAVQPAAPLVVQAEPEVAAAPATPPVVAAAKPKPKQDRVVKAAPVVAKPAAQEKAHEKAHEKVVALKPVATLAAAPVPAAAVIASQPVQAQAQIRPAPVYGQPTAPMPWLKPFEFRGVANQPAPSPVITAAPVVYEPRPNVYLAQPVNVAIAPQAPVATLPWQVPSQPQAAPAAVPAPNTYNEKDSSKSRSILPTITKVYPTGEKPMVVITFNCPTELAGIATPSTKLLHGAFDLGFGAINATNALPWTLQQVCS